MQKPSAEHIKQNLLDSFAHMPVVVEQPVDELAYKHIFDSIAIHRQNLRDSACQLKVQATVSLRKSDSSVGLTRRASAMEDNFYLTEMSSVVEQTHRITKTGDSMRHKQTSKRKSFGEECELANEGSLTLQEQVKNSLSAEITKIAQSITHYKRAIREMEDKIKCSNMERVESEQILQHARKQFSSSRKYSSKVGQDFRRTSSKLNHVFETKRQEMNRAYLKNDRKIDEVAQKTLTYQQLNLKLAKQKEEIQALEREKRTLCERSGLQVKIERQHSQLINAYVYTQMVKSSEEIPGCGSKLREKIKQRRQQMDLESVGSIKHLNQEIIEDYRKLVFEQECHKTQYEFNMSERKMLFDEYNQIQRDQRRLQQELLTGLFKANQQCHPDLVLKERQIFQASSTLSNFQHKLANVVKHLHNTLKVLVLNWLANDVRTVELLSCIEHALKPKNYEELGRGDIELIMSKYFEDWFNYTEYIDSILKNQLVKKHLKNHQLQNNLKRVLKTHSKHQKLGKSSLFAHSFTELLGEALQSEQSDIKAIIYACQLMFAFLEDTQNLCVNSKENKCESESKDIELKEPQRLPKTEPAWAQPRNDQNRITKNEATLMEVGFRDQKEECREVLSLENMRAMKREAKKNWGSEVDLQNFYRTCRKEIDNIGAIPTF